MTKQPPGSRTAVGVAGLYVQAIRAMWLGLAVNVGLALVKLVAGIASHSIAMAADALNSVGDAFTSASTIYALHFAQRPADTEHPYGHSRVEAIAALTIAVVIGASAIAVAVEAIRNIPVVHGLPPAWLLWIAGANVIIKESIYRYKMRVAKQTGSQAVLAGAWDHRSDAACSAAVLVGVAIVRYGGQSVIWADEAAALLVVVFIMVACTKLYRRTASSLMDEQCDTPTIDGIRRIAEQTPGVIRVEQIRARRSGLEILVDIHVEVNSDLTVETGHGIGHDVQRNIVDGLSAVSQVLVHVEPADRSGSPPDRPAPGRGEPSAGTSEGSS